MSSIMTPSAIGKNVYKLRGIRGWSQKKLGDESMTNGNTIHRLETGEIQRPHSMTLNRLAKALDVSVEDLELED